MSESRSEFEAWWAHERDQNLGNEIGADYRHWALLGFREGRRVALEEAAQVCFDLSTVLGEEAGDASYECCLAIRAIARKEKA
jgi:hypothetical protein